jgi:hypothetical protein
MRVRISDVRRQIRMCMADTRVDDHERVGGRRIGRRRHEVAKNAIRGSNAPVVKMTGNRNET